MSYSDALRIYRARTGNRRIPTPGSPELAMVMSIYNELMNPILSRDWEPEPPKPVVSPLAPVPEKVSMIPIVRKSEPVKVELSAEELIERENKRAEAIAKQMMEEAKKQQMRQSIIIAELQAKSPKEALAETHCANKRKYCRKRKRWLIVHEPKIISFD